MGIHLGTMVASKVTDRKGLPEAREHKVPRCCFLPHQPLPDSVVRDWNSARELGRHQCIYLERSHLVPVENPRAGPEWNHKYNKNGQLFREDVAFIMIET